MLAGRAPQAASSTHSDPPRPAQEEEDLQAGLAQLEAEEAEEEEEAAAAAPMDEEPGGLEPSSAVVLHEDKKYYPTAEETFGGAEALVQEEDAQALEVPIIAPVRQVKFEVQDKEAPPTRYGNDFLLSLLATPELARSVAVVGHLHHGKTLVRGGGAERLGPRVGGRARRMWRGGGRGVQGHAGGAAQRRAVQPPCLPRHPPPRPRAAVLGGSARAGCKPRPLRPGPAPHHLPALTLPASPTRPFSGVRS
jgi:hypothetical protein